MLIYDSEFAYPMSDPITIYEVGPRDGLQSISKEIPAEQKAYLIDMLIAAGLDKIEVGSFVNPSLVPQMKDTALVLKGINKDNNHISALIPNAKGLDLAKEAGVNLFNIYLSPSPEFNTRNLGTPSIDRILERYEIALEEVYPEQVRLYISCAFGSAFEDYDESLFVQILKWGAENAGTVVLADTTGIATQKEITTVVKIAREIMPNLAIHLHKPSSRKVEFSHLLDAAYLSGIREFDTSLGGLGGCPFVPGSFGNLPTRYLIDWASDYGIEIEQSVDIAKLEAAEMYLKGIVNIPMAERAFIYVSGKLSGIRRSLIS